MRPRLRTWGSSHDPVLLIWHHPHQQHIWICQWHWIFEAPVAPWCIVTLHVTYMLSLHLLLGPYHQVFVLYSMATNFILIATIVTWCHCLKITWSSSPSPASSLSSSLCLSRLTMRTRPRLRQHTSSTHRLTNNNHYLIIIINICCYHLTGLTEARYSLGVIAAVASHGTWNMSTVYTGFRLD